MDPEELLGVLTQHPLAVVFGTERHGLSSAALAGADLRFRVPTAGLSRSLNLSVAVALTLWSLRGASLQADAVGDMTAEHQRACYDLWVRRYTSRRFW